MSLAIKENPMLLDELQEQLNASWENNNSFYDNIWQINCESLLIGHVCQVLSENSSFFSENGISPELTIKYLLLNTFDKGKSFTTMKSYLDFLVLMFTYMQNNKIAIIEKHDLQEIFSYFLMHRFSASHSKTLQKVKIIKRLVPRSGKTCFILGEVIQKLTHTLSLHGIKIATTEVADLSVNKVIGILKGAINQISLGDLTYQDWMKGGSFNNLTLDHGRHYIGFMQNFYEENYAIAHALSHVVSKKSELLTEVGLGNYRDSHQVLYGLLIQTDLENSSKFKQFNKEKIAKLKEILDQEYIKCIMPNLIKQHILREQTIERIGKMIGIILDEDRLTHIAEFERLRNLLFFIMDDNDYPNLNIQIKNSNFDTNESKLRQIIATISKEVPKPILPTEAYIKQFVDEYYGRESGSNLLTFIRKVNQAGMSCVAAFTGWRKSEFGFPLSNISSIANHDTIDQYTLPYRHKIKWHVFKTQKGALLEREITQKTFELIQSLSHFHNPKVDEPAIYSESNGTAKKAITGKEFSGFKLENAISENWYNFYNHYKPFIALREIEELMSLSQISNNLTKEQYLRLADLSQKKDSQEWHYADGNLQLKETYELIKKELPLVSFMNLYSTASLKRNSLGEYHRHLLGQRNDIHPEILSLFEEYLPIEVKQRLAESLDEVESLQREIGAFLFSELTYPTPHGFRHIWAEAVFRRFDGDAGWMIRSNFKHISESMWLAYIADKATMGRIEQLKVNLSSSLMKNWLRNQGSKTSGKYHKFLKRLFKNTTLATYQDAESLIDKIASEDVVSIKANPWGFCINRFSTSSFAKCANDGEAKPQNASPKLCMGCINFMNCDANIDYIIEHSWQHIDLLNSEHLATIPQALITPSITFVSNARKRIAEIEPEHRILKHYDSALAKAA